MNTQSQKTNASGFTLVEFIIAMTITAIFGSIVLPSGQRVILRAHQEADKRKMQYLALTYVAALNEGHLGDTFDPRDGIVSFARTWAKVGGPDTLDFYQSAKRTKKSGKKVSLLDETIPLAGEDFDFIAVYPLPNSAVSDEMPVFFTRGLQEDGSWSKDSLYGAEGGLVAFADSQVKPYKNAKEAFSLWLKYLGVDL